uniref:Putative lysosomal-associated transmembrane protein 4a n=1 Tax=Panstrongylus lignarius TaxID=156445 RepID=A0A224XZJ5_9HEMI
MALIKSCCCCSLRAGTLIIGWLEAIGGLFGMIIVAISMYLVSQVKVEIEHEALIVKNTTELENLDEVVIGKTAFAFAMMILIGLFLYYLCFMILAIFLIVGVHKENMRFIKLWVQIKSVLLILAIIGIVIQLFLLLLGVDSRLTDQIVVAVVDGLLIMVVQSYYEQVNESTVPTY